MIETDKLLTEIEKFSNNKLKKKEDLKTLLKISDSENKFKQFEELTFTAKYVLGLQRVLKKGSMNPDITNLEKVKKDYSDNLVKATSQIKELLQSSPDETRYYFMNTYLELNQQSLQRLIELLEDLEWTKMYLNNIKRQQGS